MDHESTTWQSGISHAVRSDIGLRRANNQDSYAVALANSEDAWLARGHLFLVADGMGAHAAGAVASKLAADVVPQTYRKHAELPAPDAIHLGVQEANSVIHALMYLSHREQTPVASPQEILVAQVNMSG